METVWTGLITLGVCRAVRGRLDRKEQMDMQCLGGHVRLTKLRNARGAFGLPVPRVVLLLVSAGVLALVWARRREYPIGAGLVLGGGIGNLLERWKDGSVFDYVQFPKAPGKLKTYVFNLADFAVFLGCIGILLHREK